MPTRECSIPEEGSLKAPGDREAGESVDSTAVQPMSPQIDGSAPIDRWLRLKPKEDPWSAEIPATGLSGLNELATFRKQFSARAVAENRQHVALAATHPQSSRNIPLSGQFSVGGDIRNFLIAKYGNRWRVYIGGRSQQPVLKPSKFQSNIIMGMVLARLHFMPIRFQILPLFGTPTYTTNPPRQHGSYSGVGNQLTIPAQAYPSSGVNTTASGSKRKPDHQQLPETASKKKPKGPSQINDAFKFACPFAKFDRTRYEDVYGACTHRPGFPSVGKVMEHLKRDHVGCQSCNEKFRPSKWEDMKQEREDHRCKAEGQRRRNKEGRSPEIMNQAQECVFESEELNNPTLDRKEVWKALYQKLFGSQVEAPEPDYDFCLQKHKVANVFNANKESPQNLRLELDRHFWFSGLVVQTSGLPQSEFLRHTFPGAHGLGVPEASTMPPFPSIGMATIFPSPVDPPDIVISTGYNQSTYLTENSAALNTNPNLGFQDRQMGNMSFTPVHTRSTSSGGGASLPDSTYETGSQAGSTTAGPGGQHTPSQFPNYSSPSERPPRAFMDRELLRPMQQSPQYPAQSNLMQEISLGMDENDPAQQQSFGDDEYLARFRQDPSVRPRFGPGSQDPELYYPE